MQREHAGSILMLPGASRRDYPRTTLRSRLCLLREKRSFVGAGSPAGRDGRIEQAQIDTELAAMLVPVAEHDVAHELSSGLGQDISSARNHPPHFPHAGVAELWQQIANRGDTLFIFCEDFLAASRLRKAGEIGCLHRVILNEANYSARNEGEMISKLSGGHGFFVRLPGQLVFRKALQKS